MDKTLERRVGLVASSTWYDNTVSGLAAEEVQAAIDELTASLGANNEWSEILANGNISGGNNVIVSAGDTFSIVDLTTGSIPFAGAVGVFTQDNANLFWDNASKELGIGTNAPSAKLHVNATGFSSGLEMLRVRGGNGTTKDFVMTHGSSDGDVTWAFGNGFAMDRQGSAGDFKLDATSVGIVIRTGDGDRVLISSNAANRKGALSLQASGSVTPEFGLESTAFKTMHIGNSSGTFASIAMSLIFKKHRQVKIEGDAAGSSSYFVVDAGADSDSFQILNAGDVSVKNRLAIGTATVSGMARILGNGIETLLFRAQTNASADVVAITETGRIGFGTITPSVFFELNQAATLKQALFNSSAFAVGHLSQIDFAFNNSVGARVVAAAIVARSEVITAGSEETGIGINDLTLHGNGRAILAASSLSLPALGKLHITGEGASSATRSLYVEDVAGSLYLEVNDSGQMGLGTLGVEVSAKLEMISTTQGFLPPRMTEAQRDAITPAEGLILYNTDTNQWEGWNGTVWAVLG